MTAERRAQLARSSRVLAGLVVGDDAGRIGKLSNSARRACAQGDFERRSGSPTPRRKPGESSKMEPGSWTLIDAQWALHPAPGSGVARTLASSSVNVT